VHCWFRNSFHKDRRKFFDQPHHIHKYNWEMDGRLNRDGMGQGVIPGDVSVHDAIVFYNCHAMGF